MKVVSTNIGERKTVTWKFKQYTTGIFKLPAQDGIILDKEDVVHDVVHDRKHHGGLDKACYLFSEDQYPYWKKIYKDLKWNYGMFGENITVSDFNEKEISIGDVFRIGEAIVQVSEPRQPCSTLNMRFNSSKMVKQFVEHGYCGAYLRVIEAGRVKCNDSIEKIKASDKRLTLYEIFNLLYDRSASGKEIQAALDHPDLGIACKENLMKFHKL